MFVDCFPSADVYCDVILTSLWHHNTSITFYLYVIILHSFYIVWWGSNCQNASRLSMLFCQFSVDFSCKYSHIYMCSQFFFFTTLDILTNNWNEGWTFLHNVVQRQYWFDAQNNDFHHVHIAYILYKYFP